MSWLLTAIGAAFMGGQKIKEIRRKEIPASYWRNQELMNEDKLNPSISPQQVQKNLENGKYYLSDEEYAKRNQKRDLSQREGETLNEWMHRINDEAWAERDRLLGKK